MAELPKYQETGRIYSDLPSLDFANVRENIKLTQNINNNLDRLADFSTKIAAKETARKAEEFAVTNPITLDDLKNAEQSGLTANDLVKATGGGAIWQDTLRKFQAEQLRNQLEVSANTSALDIANQVKMRQITDPNEISAKFEALQNGMSKPLKSLDPETAMKFQASSGALIKNLHKLSLDKLYDDYVLDKKVETKNYEMVAVKLAESIYEAESDPQIINSQTSLLRKTYSAIAREGGADFAYTSITALDKKFEDIKINYFVKLTLKDTFDKDPKALEKITSGDFGEPGANFKFAALSYDDQEKIISESIKRRANKLDSIDKTKKINLANLEKENQKNWKLVFDSNSPLKKNEKDSLVDGMFDSGYMSRAEVKAYYKGENGDDDGDPILAGSIKRQIWQGTIKTESEVKKLSAGRLSSKQIGGLISLVGQRDFAATSAGIKTIVNDNNKPWENKKYDTMNDLSDDVEARLQANPNITGEQALKDANTARVNSEKYQRALKRQKTYFEKYPNSNFDKESAENYIKRKGINKDSSEARNLLDDYDDYIKQKNITHVLWTSLSDGAK
jgi:hypothetical protein